MAEAERKTIYIPEISRVEGHAAVDVVIENGCVKEVKLDVFEGTRFFEQIVVGHKFDEIAHLTSRVCAICSTGHVIAAVRAIETIFSLQPNRRTELYRELMHLGMIIESHATHIYALALPDFLNTPDLVSFATGHPDRFAEWTLLRNLGASIQTAIGGRPFHPVNLHVGGLSFYSPAEDLQRFTESCKQALPVAESVCRLLLEFKPKVARTTQPVFLALIPDSGNYGFFGQKVRCSGGWEADIQSYPDYLMEHSVPYSHAKKSAARGQSLMVGSMARLALFGDRLGGRARELFVESPLADSDTNTLWNNLAQAIEVVYALERVPQIIAEIESLPASITTQEPVTGCRQAGWAAGAVECPRGTLYHSYELDAEGTILRADMITPSAQNTARIELDIKEVVENEQNNTDATDSNSLQKQLETLVRAYDPCNTCATHMVQITHVPPEQLAAPDR